jgi:hypothetical protein
MRSGSDGRGRSGRGKAHLGFTVGRRWRGPHTGIELRRGSRLPWATTRMGRDADWRDVLGSLTGGADCFREQRRGVAGKAPGDGELRLWSATLVLCGFGQKKTMTR